MVTIEQGVEFLEWLESWFSQLPEVTFGEVFPDPSRGAILVEDLLIGFCREGPLAGERVNSIVPISVRLLEAANRRGLTRVVMSQDAHTPSTPEFEAWPVHCVRGTREAELVPELRSLPFASAFTVIEKNCLSTSVDPTFHAWLEENDDLTDYLVTGDCTDLCVYQLAMAIRMWVNATDRQGRRVTVAESAVQTYDFPVSAADGALPHPSDLMHHLFLYHMALNGIHVVKNISL